MQVVILCNNRSKEELLDQKKNAEDLIWITRREDFLLHRDAKVFVDLLFENTKQERALLQQLASKVMLVNSVSGNLEALPPSFVRLNGWPGFLRGPVVEATGTDGAAQQLADNFFASLGKSVEWLPDLPGFITPRVVAMIINEAFFALEDGVSTREEIDTAMKLGTNYPYGPFEWAELIGLRRVSALLQKLAEEQPRYTPCPLLLQEVSQQGATRPTG